MKHSAYTEILPGDPLHRKIIEVAIATNDRHALKALKGRLDHPIHYVQNWFSHGLMASEDSAVIIYSLSAKRDWAKFKESKGEPVYDLLPLPAEDQYTDLFQKDKVIP